MERPDPTTQSIRQTIAEHLAQIEQRHEGTFRCTPTGLAQLDQVLGGGLNQGGLYLVASRPAVGKTIFSLNIALSILRSKRPVAMFVPQEEHLEIARRLISIEGSLSLHTPGAFTPGTEFGPRWDEARFASFTEAAHRLATLPLVTNNDARITPSKIREASEQHQTLHGDLGLIILDSLEAMGTASNVRSSKLHELMSELKQIAVDLNVPVIVSSLLHRSIEARSDKRPMLTDVTTGIESLADVVLLLYRDQIYYANSPNQGTLEVFVSKNRWGKRGVIHMSLSDEHGTIDSMPLA